MVKANDVTVKQLNFTEALPGGEISIDVPGDVLKIGGKTLLLSFALPNAAIPSEIGWNSDIRRLGIWLTQIQVKSLS